jgi:hypothetical protein
MEKLSERLSPGDRDSVFRIGCAVTTRSSGWVQQPFVGLYGFTFPSSGAGTTKSSSGISVWRGDHRKNCPYSTVTDWLPSFVNETWNRGG